MYMYMYVWLRPCLWVCGRWQECYGSLISIIIITMVMSHKGISNAYTHRFPSKKGLCERSIRRLCKKHSLPKPTGTDLDEIVEKSVEEVRV